MVGRAAVQLLQLRAQHPFQMRVDDRQRLVEQDGATSERTRPRPSEIFCFGSAVSPLALRCRSASDRASRRSRATRAAISAAGDAAVAQRERQIVGDRHGVVDDRELEHLGDVALLRSTASVTSLPSNSTCPCDGVTRPEMMLSSVVLPQPDGPSSA